MRLLPTSPSIHSTRPVVTGKALLFQFFSPATVTAFSCRLNLHCFCVLWSSTTFSGPWELYLLIPTNFSSLWLKKTSLWLKKVRLLILLYRELLRLPWINSQEVKIISHGQTQWTFGLLIMDVRIILLLRTQVFLKINVLNGKESMLYFAIFFGNILMPRLYIILGPIKLATLSGIR